MPTSFALNPHFENFIREQVASGRYNNASEVVRAGLRLLEDQCLHTAQLRAELAAGLASGEARDADAVFNRLEDKYRR